MSSCSAPWHFTVDENMLQTLIFLLNIKGKMSIMLATHIFLLYYLKNNKSTGVKTLGGGGHWMHGTVDPNVDVK
jgi:hypothetical protein